MTEKNEMMNLAAQEHMRVVAVTQPGVDTEARWVKKGGRSVFGYKQPHWLMTMV